MSANPVTISFTFNFKKSPEATEATMLINFPMEVEEAVEDGMLNAFDVHWISATRTYEGPSNDWRCTALVTAPVAIVSEMAERVKSEYHRIAGEASLYHKNEQ